MALMCPAEFRTAGNNGDSSVRRSLVALQFLTIIPIRKGMRITEEDISGSSSFFVMVGLLQGALLAAVAYVSGRVFDAGLSAGVVLLVYVLSNGGFHLDGLADTFDALASKGDSGEKLSVMRDSAIGPIGAISVFFSLLIKYLAIKNLAILPPFTVYSSLLFMPAFSKLALVISMFHGKSARTDGLGSLFIEKVRVTQVLYNISALFLAIIAAQGLFSNYAAVGQYMFYAMALLSVYFLCLISAGMFGRKFGGLTGDTLGATGEIADITFLLLVIVWSRLFI